MPAQRTSDTKPVSVRPGHILAKSDGVSDLMVHAMLFDGEKDRADVTSKTQLKIAHMGPPLGNATKSCDAVGGMELTDEQKLRIKNFITQCKDATKKRDKEYRLRGLEATSKELYVILPSAKPPSGDFAYWRFSCVGFVLKAYEQIPIYLLKGPIPERTLADLKSFYPFFSADLDKADTREHLGIGTGDRWPVELVGYVLHSFARNEADVIAGPYAPQLGDEYFPRQFVSGGAPPKRLFGKQ